MMRNRYWKRRGRHAGLQHFRWVRLALFAAFLFLIVFGLTKLTNYWQDFSDLRQLSEELRQIYDSETAILKPESTVLASDSPTTAPLIVTIPPATLVPSKTNDTQLSTVLYPNNPKLKINSRFGSLQKKNRDIIGWLTIGDLLDEAVVQRDEAYYMDHDVSGKKNVNGAIFMDSGISLKTRPYTIILYGHNMKTGAMFGCLRNFENPSYYHNEPFINFDTMYEEGRYVIFAAGSISMDQYAVNYVDFFALTTNDIQTRIAAINALKAASVHTCTIDVQPDDQLLVLVTCVEKDEERRIIAARRIRDDDNEKDLTKAVNKSRKKQ